MRTKISRARFYVWWLIRFVCKMLISIVLAALLRFSDKYKDLWLIMELPKEARDNGYWLYKYIVENHPEVNVRYVLAEDSPDYAKMPAKDRIIRPYSWQHYVAYVLCGRSISTHIYGASPGRYYTKIFPWIMYRKKEVFLQHGVLRNSIPLRGFSGWTIASSPTEIRHFVDSGHKNVEKILQVGLCRFDGLRDESQSQKHKIILIMPTFRSWLGGYALVPKKVFLQSDFYKKWQSLLADPDFNRWVEESNHRVIFYPHRQMQGFVDLFKVSSDNFEVATKSDYDIQDLLRKSSLLITDYSSVFNDFLYMKKQVIFYPFDENRFYAERHMIDGKPSSLGKYSKKKSDLVRSIKQSSKNGFKISKKISREIDNFFTYTDNRNCERNFNTIKELK